jgi:hypothetical protein
MCDLSLRMLGDPNAVGPLSEFPWDGVEHLFRGNEGLAALGSRCLGSEVRERMDLEVNLALWVPVMRTRNPEFGPDQGVRQWWYDVPDPLDVTSRGFPTLVKSGNKPPEVPEEVKGYIQRCVSRYREQPGTELPYPEFCRSCDEVECASHPVAAQVLMQGLMAKIVATGDAN